MAINHFDINTPESVKRVLNSLVNTKARVRLCFGDADGKSWDEEFDTIGTIGNSTGQKKIALLIANRRSLGGAAILTAHIIKIVETKTGLELYKHPLFTQGSFTVVTPSDLAEFEANVMRDGEIYGRCSSKAKAERLAAFMNGMRNSK